MINNKKSQKVKYKVILIRHGQSEANKNKVWGSWTDVDLSEEGIQEVKNAAKLLKNYKFDICYTSFLLRTIKTWNILAEELDLHHIEVIKSWRLNEKHYGDLIGLNKIEICKKYGDDQLKKFRRDYSSRPPLLKQDDRRNPIYDEKYKFVPKSILPLGEVNFFNYHFKFFRV